MKLLKGWIIRGDPSGERGVLIGAIYGDDRFEDGTIIRTSRIVSLEGNIAITTSGTVYTLGQKGTEV